MNEKRKLGQYYTTNHSYIIGNLINDLPQNEEWIDPFAGQGDLLSSYKNTKGYDIDPRHSDVVERDTLLNPLDYTNKWIITNPPYLYISQSKDRKIFDIYNESDLYKCSMKSIMSSLGGILIVPTNLFCDEDDLFRKSFFSKFQIIRLNIFERDVFEDTGQVVCSFSFIKKDNLIQKFPTIFFPSNDEEELELKYENGYKIGDEFFDLINDKNLDKKIKVKRLIEGSSKWNNIFLRAVDTGTSGGRIKLEFNRDPYFGTVYDRTVATICISQKLNEDQEKYIIKRFNEILEFYRKKYRSMFLTTARNSTRFYVRKRISFDKAYKLINYIITNEINKDRLING